MFDEVIQKVAGLMQEQAAAYRQLDTATAYLANALVGGAPEAIEALTRTGEAHLHLMRSRLLQIMFALAEFAEARAKTATPQSIAPATRQDFETASRALLEAARTYQATSTRAASLAIGGTSFASACIEECGFPPTTYHLPFFRRLEPQL